MNVFITKAYDFHDALEKLFSDVDITETKEITPYATLVSSNFGQYWMESMEVDGVIYMKVTQYID